jgi:hypothetical protein
MQHFCNRGLTLLRIMSMYGQLICSNELVHVKNSLRNNYDIYQTNSEHDK